MTNDTARPATPEQKAEHLSRLLSCQHVTAARYTGTRSVPGPGNWYELEPIADVSSLSYGDIDRDWGAGWKIDRCAPPADWTPDTVPGNAIAVLEFTVYSDYSGSTVERSNEAALSEDYKSAEWLKSVWGGHGTSGLAIDVQGWLDSLTDTDEAYADGSSILDTIESLEDYPLVSDDDHSRLETELEDEAIPEAVKDIARPLWKYTRLQTLIEDMPADVAYECYRAACEATNTYPHCESAVSCYIDTDRIRAAFICEAYTRRHTAAA